MSRAKQVTTRKRRKAMPVLGAAGLLALASSASAEAPADTMAPNAGVRRPVLLHILGRLPLLLRPLP